MRRWEIPSPPNFGEREIFVAVIYHQVMTRFEKAALLFRVKADHHYSASPQIHSPVH